MTVKDVLQSLVDDNMVDCERVGTSNYYWAFPSKALNARKHKLEELQKQVCSCEHHELKALRHAGKVCKNTPLSWQQGGQKEPEDSPEKQNKHTFALCLYFTVLVMHI